jgi:hypothetical protein
MNVKELDVYEISRKLERYIADYFNGYRLGANESMLQEGYLLYFEEIESMLPKKYLKLFADKDKFLCMSGFIALDKSHGETEQHVISLLMDEQGERAFLLCLEKTNEDGEEKTIIIKDFLA